MTQINSVMEEFICEQDVSNMLLSTHGNFSSSLVSGMATLKRTKNRRASTVPNPKKMYEEVRYCEKN